MTDRVELEVRHYCTAPNGECIYKNDPYHCAEPVEGDSWVCDCLEIFGKPKQTEEPPTYLNVNPAENTNRRLREESDLEGDA